MKNRLKAKIARKYNQRMRIYEMYLICKAYEMYHLMQLHASCAKGSMNYEQAESFSTFMNDVFLADTTPETFMVDCNEQADLSIEYYEKFQHVLEGMDEIMKDSILSFCKSVYFGCTCMGLKIEGFLYYPLYLEALIKYTSGFGTLKEVREAIVDFKPWYDKPRRTDSWKFRRDFRIIEKIFSNITEKRKRRQIRHSV